jgi:hypothetical protein
MPKTSSASDDGDKEAPASGIMVTTKRNSNLMPGIRKGRPAKRVSRKMF